MKNLRRDLEKDGDEQMTLLDVQNDWQRYWWDMPTFDVNDQRPVQQITVSFATDDDVQAFARLLDVTLTKKTSGLWWPKLQLAKPSEYVYDDET